MKILHGLIKAKFSITQYNNSIVKSWKFSFFSAEDKSAQNKKLKGTVKEKLKGVLYET